MDEHVFPAINIKDIKFIPGDSARAGIQFSLILALVLIESMALYTFAIIFAKVR